MAQVANTFFTQLPGVIAQAPVQNAPPVATAQNGQAVHAYVTQSSRGTWLFQPSQNGDGTVTNPSPDCEAERPAPLPAFLVSA